MQNLRSLRVNPEVLGRTNLKEAFKRTKIVANIELQFSFCSYIYLCIQEILRFDTE